MTQPDPLVEQYKRVLADLRGFDVAPKFTALLYGSYGSGKTVLAYRLAQLVTPEDKTILHLDTSEGYVSINNHPELKRRVQPMQSNLTQSQIILLCEYIRQGVGIFAKVGTIILDESNPVVRNAILETAKLREIRQRNTGKLVLDADAVDRMDYGIAQNKLMPLWKALLSLPRVNLILTAHVRTGEENGISIKTADFPQAIRKDVIRFSHVVGYLTADLQKDGDYKREIQVLPTTTVEARTRVGGMETRVNHDELLSAVDKWMSSDAVNKSPEFNGYEIVE